jgi:hypothetical protein
MTKISMRVRVRPMGKGKREEGGEERRGQRGREEEQPEQEKEIQGSERKGFLYIS